MANEKRLIDANELDGKLEALAQKYAAQGRPEVAKDYSFVQTILLTARTVDAVEVVHGRWEYWSGGLLRCPVCGYEYTDYLERKNYCGNCGAKMDADTTEQPEM